jgi:hypothetical protein
MIENFKLEILGYSDLNDWDEKIRKTEQGTVFNTRTWAEILKDVFGLENKVFCIIKNDNIIGALPVFYKIKYGIKVITQIPLTLYNGPLFFFENEIKKQKREQYQVEILEKIIPAIQNEFRFCNFSGHPSVVDLRPFSWNHWDVIPQYTYQISLGDEEGIRENFSSSLRRKLTHGDGGHFIIQEENEPENLISLHQESYSRKGRNIILDKGLLKNYIEKVQEKKLVKIFKITDSNGMINSCRAILQWNNIVYDWIAGTSSNNKENNATHFLVWNILRQYSREGYIKFDFMGANTKNIIDFKRMFGGELIPYFEVKYSSKWFKILLNINDIRHKLSS